MKSHLPWYDKIYRFTVVLCSNIEKIFENKDELLL